MDVRASSKHPEFQPFTKWTPHIGPSELTLPAWSAANQEIRPSLALIDGGHGLQTVFVDFVYINLLLRKGSVLLVDDQQLGAIKLLNNVLIESGDYRVIDATPKLVGYQKLTDRPLLSDWRSQEATQRELAKLF